MPRTKNIPIGPLDQMARDTVGDGGAPNLFFVSLDGKVIAVMTEFEKAYELWDSITTKSRYGERKSTSLEDRKHGVVSDYDYDSESKRMEVRDDTYTFKLQKKGFRKHGKHG